MRLRAFFGWFVGTTSIHTQKHTQEVVGSYVPEDNRHSHDDPRFEYCLCLNQQRSTKEVAGSLVPEDNRHRHHNPRFEDWLVSINNVPSRVKNVTITDIITLASKIVACLNQQRSVTCQERNDRSCGLCLTVPSK